MEKPNKILLFGLIIGLSLVLAATIIAQTLLDIRDLDNVISVSGSAKQAVAADSARFTSNFSRTISKEQLKDGYSQMKADEEIVRSFFGAQGFSDKIEISPVFMNEIYKSDSYAPKEYNLIQNIEIKSGEVEKMKELAKNSGQLAEQGILFSANPVEYYYSNLPEVRISLLPEAIKDAKKRAEAIAVSTGKRVETVKAVTMGVVQVMPIGAVEISDYGSYDTSGINKEVMITVKATFNLK